MALPKKGTRRIAIEGEHYRWIVSPNDGFITLVVELAESPGQCLTAFFNYLDLYEPAGPGRLKIVGQRCSIRPGVVRAVIEAALESGWRPKATGKRPYRLDVDATREIQERMTAKTPRQDS